jgi:hypothetical protein
MRHAFRLGWHQDGNTSLQPLAFALAAALLTFGPMSRATVRFVSIAGSDGDGLSWGTAKRTVSGALAAATANDQIWVAAGVYNEGIVMKNGVALYGGFAGGEVSLIQRNWVLNSSVLNGQGTGNSVVTVPSGCGPDTRVDGLVIQGGTAYYGGGVSISASAVVIANNRIKLNMTTGGAGAGIYIFYLDPLSGSPTVTNNIITQNHAISTTLTNGNGGGIAVFASAPVIAWNVISGNLADLNGGGIVIYAGINTNQYGDSRPLILGNVIQANSAADAWTTFAGAGGGIFASATAMNGQPCGLAVCAPMIVNNVIAANGAGIGGGVNLGSSLFGAATLINNTIVANNDSGVCWGDTAPTNCNNLVAFNRGGFQQAGATAATLRCNNVFGNTWTGVNNDYLGLANATGLNGNLSAEPSLANYSIGNFRLQPTSPCRNAGLPLAAALAWPDADGRYRNDGAVDIGAYESTGATLIAPTPVYYVSPAGNDNWTGTSWETPKRTVQAAINAAPGGEVWVLQGTYTENLLLPAFVRLYGGFAGGEANRAARNPAAHPTILDGGSLGNVIKCENSGYLVSGVDGFTLQNGRAAQGAAIRCWVGSPVIANNIIRNNALSGASPAFGAGIYCYCGNAQVTGNIITNNLALVGSSQGGGFCSSYSLPSLEGNLIGWNRAVDGSAIYAFQGGARIAGNTIIYNSYYGTLQMQRAAVVLDSCGDFLLDGNLIGGNTSAQGGGIYIFTPFGGVVRNNHILYNQAAGQYFTYGGGLYGNFYPNSGGPNFPVSIYNNTFVGNSAVYGPYGDTGAMALMIQQPNVVVANNIIAFNSGGIGLVPGSTWTPNLLNNCLYYNPNGNYYALSAGAGDINQDPQFVNRAAGDYHLQATSPCIDAGTASNAPTNDCVGVARSLDGNNDGTARCDIGAYEYVHPLANTDHDAMPDWAEAIAGTNPTDPASVLKLQSCHSIAGNGVALSWPSVTGRSYCIQYKTAVSEGWQVLSNNIPGCGTVMEVQDCPAGRTNRLYRLQVGLTGSKRTGVSTSLFR